MVTIETIATVMEDGTITAQAPGSRGAQLAQRAAGQLASTSPLTLRTLDAIHLAVAVEHKATMATLDGRLSEAARAMGIKILP